MEKLTNTKYKEANKKIYRVGNIINGIYKFIPVEFTGSYTSLLNMSVHSTITDLVLAKTNKMSKVNFNYNISYTNSIDQLMLGS